MQHVFVETNWLVAYAAPVHHQVPAAQSLLDRAQAGQLRLYFPAVCLNEARRAIQNKYQPRNEAKAIRTFLVWGKENGRVSADEDALVRRVVDMFQAKIEADLKMLDATLSALRTHPGVEVFALDQDMLERSIDLSFAGCEFKKPFDQVILAALLVRAERLRAAGEVDLAFCEKDTDLQPWDRSGDAKLWLKRLYDAAGIWVYGDFDLNAPAPPAGWPAAAKT